MSIFLIMGLFIGPIVGGIYAHSDMSDQIEQNAVNVDTLPNTSQDSVRVLPRSVADQYSESSMQKPQYKITNSDITEVNGEYVWSYGIVPDNLVVALQGNQIGAMYTNMEGVEKNVTIDDNAIFKNGRGQMWFDSYTYQSVLSTPLKYHNWKTTFNTKHNEESYIVHSTTTHNWKFRLFPIPQPYAVPEHGSVEVMNTDGNIDSLSPDEAQEQEYLKGENFYPYHLTMFKIESTKYENGYFNKLFTKKGVLNTADLPEGGNSWPITVPTQDGNSTELKYFVAAGPAGSGSGVFEVWVFDGQTGDPQYQSYNNSQTGPGKAVKFVSQEPQVNRLSSAKVVAPVPIVNDGNLYWHTKVVPESDTGIIYTAFVNAQTGEVTLVEGTEQVYAFLTEEEVDSIQDDENETRSDSTRVTVVITDKNGEIQGTTNLTLPDGGSVELKVEDSNNETSDQSQD